jgi:hypothetical protein
MTLDRLDENCKPQTSCLQDSHAKTSVDAPARMKGSTARSLVFGGRSSGLLASLDPASYAWKTSQTSLFVDCQRFLERCPRSGMTASGKLFRLHSLAPLIFDGDSSLLRTPTTMDAKMTGYPKKEFTGRDRGCLAQQLEGGYAKVKNFQPGKDSRLSALFVEDMMGFPLGFTDVTD